jgi:uncharacterized protein (DUF302 family)
MVTDIVREGRMSVFAYTVTSRRDFAATVAAVEEQSRTQGFSVLHVHDVAATLAAKGFRREPLKIIEVCNAAFAQRALATDPLVALMLPCPIAVFEQAGVVRVSTMRPRAMIEFYPQAGLADVAAEVDAIVCAIVDRAAGS